MSKRAREWKAWRAAARGELPNLSDEHYRSFRQRAEQDRAEGYGWFADGLEGLSTDAVFKELARIGIVLDPESFREQAAGLPGPTEVSDAWESRAQIMDERDEHLPWLAARALWARLMEDDPSIETEADAIEEGIRQVRKAGAAGDPLPVLRRIADAAEGDVEVFDALAAQIHTKIGSWVIRQLETYRGAADVDAFIEVGRSLAATMESTGLAETALALFLCHHERPEEARAQVSQAIADFGDAAPILRRAADVYAELEDGPAAERLAVRAIVLSDDDDEAADAKQVLARALKLQDRSSDLPQIYQETLAERRRRDLEKRAERRKRDKKARKVKKR